MNMTSQKTAKSLVPKPGFEPGRLSAGDFESCLYRFASGA